MQLFDSSEDAVAERVPSEFKHLDCPICMQLLADPFVTPCGHTFCYECISRHLETAKNCPCCQTYLTIELVHPNFLLNKIVQQARRGDIQDGSAFDIIQRILLDSQAQLQPAQIESLLQLLRDLRRSSQQSERSTTLSLLLHFLRRAREDKFSRLEELHDELCCLEQDLQQVQGAAAAGSAEVVEGLGSMGEGGKAASVAGAAPVEGMLESTGLSESKGMSGGVQAPCSSGQQAGDVLPAATLPGPSQLPIWQGVVEDAAALQAAQPVSFARAPQPVVAQQCVQGVPLASLLPGMGPGWWPPPLQAQVAAQCAHLHPHLAGAQQHNLGAAHAASWAAGFPGSIPHPLHAQQLQLGAAPSAPERPGASSPAGVGQQGRLSALPSAPGAPRDQDQVVRAAQCVANTCTQKAAPGQNGGQGGARGSDPSCSSQHQSGPQHLGQPPPASPAAPATAIPSQHSAAPHFLGQIQPVAALLNHSPFYHQMLLQQSMASMSGLVAPLAPCTVCNAQGNSVALLAATGAAAGGQGLHGHDNLLQQLPQQQPYTLESAALESQRVAARYCQGTTEGGAPTGPASARLQGGGTGRAGASSHGPAAVDRSAASGPCPPFPPIAPLTSIAKLEEPTAARGKRGRIASAFDDLQECYKQLRCVKTNQQVVSGAGCTAASGSGDGVPSANKQRVGGVVDVGLQEFSRILSMLTRYNRLEVLADIPRVPSRGGSGSGSASSNIISSLEFNKEGTQFATAGVSKRISIYEYDAVLASSARCGCPPAAPLLELLTRSKLSCLAWNKHTPAHIASSDYEGVVAVWDVNSSRVVAEYEAHGKRIWCLDYCGQLAGSGGCEALLASASDDCTVKLWSTSSPNSVGQVELKANVCAVKWRPGGCHQLAVGSADHSAYLYDLRAPTQPVMTFMGHRKAVSYVRFCGVDDLVSASTDSTLRLWNLGGGNRDEERLQRVFEGHVNEKNFVGLAVDGNFIACGSETNDVFVYYKALTKPVASQSFSSSIIGVDEDEGCGPLAVQSDVAGREQHQFISAMCWKPGNEVLVVANSQGAVKVMRLTGDGSS